MRRQDGADRVVAHRITHILQRADHAGISPRSILFGELDDYLLDDWIDAGPSWIVALPGPVTLSRDELSVPGQQRLRVAHRHHFRQGLFPEPCAEVGLRWCVPRH